MAALVEELDEGWDVATAIYHLPPPDPDPITGAYDVYLVKGVATLADTFADHDTSFGGFDRRSAYSVLDVTVADAKTTLDPDATCRRSILLRSELYRAFVMRASPAMDPGSARAMTTYLARLSLPCAASLDLGASAFQGHPDFAVMDADTVPDALDAASFARGAFLFHAWLDDTFGTTPGGFPVALLALTPTKSQTVAARFEAEPDAFDVLRASMKDALSTGSSFEDVLLAFAVARSFFGSADDGIHLFESRPLLANALVRKDWQIPWPSTPRRLSSPYALSPTGSSLVVVDTRDAPKGARLRVEIEWEEHAKMRWSAVKVDREGRKRAAIPIAAYDKAVEAQGTLTELDGVAWVYVVGVAVGEPFVPIDPDDGSWEPHGYLLTLAEAR